MDWEIRTLEVDPEEVALAAAVAFSSAATMQLLKEHREVNDHLLPHVYLSQVGLWMREQLSAKHFDDDARAAALVIESALDRNIAVNLIDVSFFEEFDLSNTKQMIASLPGHTPLLREKFEAHAAAG